MSFCVSFVICLTFEILRFAYFYVTYAASEYHTKDFVFQTNNKMLEAITKKLFPEE